MGEGRFQSTSSSPPSETVVDSGRAGSRARQGALAGEPWYQEVIELRKQANDYKVGPALYCTALLLCCAVSGMGDRPGAAPHVPPLHPADLPTRAGTALAGWLHCTVLQAAKRESLSALALAISSPR